MAEKRRVGGKIALALVGATLLTCACCVGSCVAYWNDVPAHRHQQWIATVTHRSHTAEGRHELMGACGEADGARTAEWARERARDAACHRLCRSLGEVTVDFVGASQCEADCASSSATYRCEGVEHEHGKSNGERIVDDFARDLFLLHLGWSPVRFRSPAT